MTHDFDAPSFVGDIDRRALQELSSEIIRKRVVLVAGAGLSVNAPRDDGGADRLPQWAGLARVLAQGLGAKHQHDDPIAVADLYEGGLGRAALVSAIQRLIADDEYVPGSVHELVCQLNFRAIVTTNFDTLIERTFEKLGIQTYPVWSDDRLVNAPRRPRIVKMNGCIKNAAPEIVISSRDFHQYRDRRPLIHSFVSNCFTEGRVCFLGFGLRDPVLQKIFIDVRKALGSYTPEPFVLAVGLSDDERRQWERAGMRPIGIPVDAAAPHETGRRVEAVLKALVDRQREVFSEQHVVHRIDPGVGWPGDQGPSSRRGRLRRATRSGSIYEPGLDLTREAWAPIAADVDAILDPTEDVVPTAEDLTLGTWAALQLLMASPLLGDDVDADLLGPDASRWRFDAALTALLERAEDPKDVNVRTRLQVLRTLFAPVAHVSEYISRLLNGRNHVGIEAMPLKHEPSPYGGKGWWQEVDHQAPMDESHTPVLGFVGAFERARELYRLVAAQLRRRSPGDAGADGAPAWRASESCLRFSSLMRGSGRDVWEQWPVPRYYRRELDRVAGRMVLNPTLQGRYDRWPVDALLTGLLTIARGWLFSQSMPPALQDAWREAEDEVSREGVAHAAVPWECMLFVSLPFGGERVMVEHQHLLGAAYRAAQIDPGLIIDYARRRLEGGGFAIGLRRSSRRLDDGGGLLAYERGLAALLEWLFAMLDDDRSDAAFKTRRYAVDALIDPLVAWLGSRPPEEARDSLQAALVRLRRWQPSRVGEEIRRLLSNERQSEARALALRRLNDPGDGGKVLLDDDDLDELLLWAQATKREGTNHRFDLQHWFIRCYAASRLSPEINRRVVEHLAACLRSDAEKGVPGWLRLAAWIIEVPELAEAVAGRMSMDGKGSIADLVAFVGRHLGRADQDVWFSQAAGNLEYLVAFVPHIDRDLLALAEKTVEKGASSEDKDGNALALLASLLHRGPKELREQAHERWVAWAQKLVARGAIGRGTMGPVVHLLSEEAITALVDNISLLLADPGWVDPAEVVAWAVGSLPPGGPGKLGPVEERLIHAIAAADHRLALPALQAVRWRMAVDPSFAWRHRSRLRHVAMLVERRSSARSTSRFAMLLGELSEEVAGSMTG